MNTGKRRKSEPKERKHSTKLMKRHQEKRRLPWWLSIEVHLPTEETWVQSQSGGISHAAKQLAREHSLGPAALQPVIGSRGSGCSEKPAHLSPKGSLLATCYRKATCKKTQHSKKMNRILKEREWKPETGVEQGKWSMCLESRGQTEGAEMCQFRQDFRFGLRNWRGHGKTVRICI